MKPKLQNGFTLIELLVVVAVIGFVSSVALASTKTTREKAKYARAKADLHQLTNAIALLEAHTGKWPNGCPPAEWENPEVYLDDPWAGLTAAPPVGVPATGSGPTRNSCRWTAAEVANWRGPYAFPKRDPWGNRYIFDPDFCNASNRIVVALVSPGPDHVETYPGNCGLSNYFGGGGEGGGDDVVIYPGSSELAP